MSFALRRTSDGEFELTTQHEAIVAPRKGTIDWESFRASDFTPDELDRAAAAWQVRALQEFHSLALFTQLTSQLHLLGAPLDWSGAFARMIADEVRHTDLCLRMCDSLGRPAPPTIDETELHLGSPHGLATQVREVVLAAFCIGETLSGRMFRRALKAATVPLARDVVGVIVTDETFHGELGWELGALLMRGLPEEERHATGSRLPELFKHYAGLCCALPGPTWARREPEAQAAPNFGTLSEAGYGRAFFDGMEEDVVPGLEAIGLVEARQAYADLLASLPA